MSNKCCDFLKLFFQQLDITNTALADQENKNSDWSSDTDRLYGAKIPRFTMSTNIQAVIGCKIVRPGQLTQYAH